MSSAGYGNHTPANEADAKSDSVKPAAGGELSVAETQSGTQPGVSPPAPEERPGSTPGAGAMPDGAQGDEVDPGAG